MLERFEELEKKEKLTLVCGAIMLIAAIFVMGTGFNRDNNLKPVNKVNNEQVNEVINKELGDNYTMTVEETVGQKKNKYVFYSTEKIKLYESSKEEKGYLEYNNKMFEMDGKTRELTKYEGKPSYINNPFYDLDLIKEFTGTCEYEYAGPNEAKCNIKLKDYLTYHNSKYGTTYVGNDDYIVLNVRYGEKLNEINIDYTVFNKTINISEEKMNININIRYNSNNFDVIYENYKEILEQ